MSTPSSIQTLTGKVAAAVALCAKIDQVMRTLDGFEFAMSTLNYLTANLEKPVELERRIREMSFQLQASRISTNATNEVNPLARGRGANLRGLALPAGSTMKWPRSLSPSGLTATAASSVPMMDIARRAFLGDSALDSVCMAPRPRPALSASRCLLPQVQPNLDTRYGLGSQ